MEVKAYKTISGYLFKKFPLGQTKENYDLLYSYYETIYLFNESKQLTNCFNYYETTEEGRQYMSNQGCERYLVYTSYMYDVSGETPTKDLSIIKDALEESDYLYLERPSFSYGYVENTEDIFEMSDSDFSNEIKCDYLKSDYSASNNFFYIEYGIEVPYIVDENTKYNAILTSFTFEIKGRLNGRYFAKSFIFKLTTEDYYHLQGNTKDETGVYYLPDKDVNPDMKYSFMLDTALQIKDDDVILRDDEFLSLKIYIMN